MEIGDKLNQRALFHQESFQMKIFFVLLLFATTILYGQEFSKAIEDNSYFIEEAYNQEERVVQHIVNGAKFSPGNVFETSFTQEWPAFGQLHQLSFTVPFIFTSATNPASRGIGDLLINYRYQLMRGNGLAISPRVSIIVPTGDETKGFGNGVAGVQFNLPVSKRFTNEFVTHYNAGLTLLPNVQFGASKAAITEYFMGVSGIYLTNSNFNVMAELLYTSSGSSFRRTEEFVFSPGVRWAIDIDDLQIVPGLAFPFSFNSGAQSNGFFFYVSFEHPY